MDFDIPRDLKVWNQVVSNPTTGKLTTAYDAFAEFKMRTGAKSIVGIYVATADSKPTDAVNGFPLIKANSDDLGIADQVLPGPVVICDGDAASATQGSYKLFYPYSPPVKNIDKAGITFSISCATGITEGVDAAIQLVTCNKEKIPFALALAYLGNFPLPFSGSDKAVEAAGIGDAVSYGSWGTTDADSIKVPAKAAQFRYINPVVSPNAVTESDPIVPTYKLECDDIPDFGPQEHITMAVFDSILGTVINRGSGISNRLLPFVFPLPGKGINVLVSDKCTVVNATQADGILTMGWI